MNNFVIEMTELRKIRNISVRSVTSEIDLAKEMNKKWISLVNLLNNNPDVLYGISVNRDDFNDFLHSNNIIPKEIKKKTNIGIMGGPLGMDNLSHYSKFKSDEEISPLLSMRSVYDRIEPFIPYKVTPLRDITKDNLIKELLNCLLAVAQYARSGLTTSEIRPLCERITFLKYWKCNGINYDEIEQFEADRINFLTNIINKIIE